MSKSDKDRTGFGFTAKYLALAGVKKISEAKEQAEKHMEDQVAASAAYKAQEYATTKYAGSEDEKMRESCENPDEPKKEEKSDKKEKEPTHEKAEERYKKMRNSFTDKEKTAEAIGIAGITKITEIRNSAKERARAKVLGNKRVNSVLNFKKYIEELKIDDIEAYKTAKNTDSDKELADKIEQTVRKSKKDFKMKTKDGQTIEVQSEQIGADVKNEKEKERPEEQSTLARGLKKYSAKVLWAMAGYVKNFTIGQNPYFYGRGR